MVPKYLTVWCMHTRISVWSSFVVQASPIRLVCLDSMVLRQEYLKLWARILTLQKKKPSMRNALI